MYSIERFIADSTRFWTLVTLVATVGIVTGFAIPLAASYQSQKFYEPTAAQLPNAAVVVIPTAVPVEMVAPTVDRDAEMARLAARNRRLEVLVNVLRQKAETAAGERPDD